MENKPRLSFMTFDDFIKYGKEHGGNIVNGMPWSFDFYGYQVTNENDNCYLISNKTECYKFTPYEIIVIKENRFIAVIEAKHYYNFVTGQKTYSIHPIRDFYYLEANKDYVGEIYFEKGEWKFSPKSSNYTVWDLEEIARIIKTLPIGGNK